MTASQFLHGVETIEVSSATQPITISKLATVGIVGTAPDADPDAFPLDTPVLLTSAPQKAASLGSTGTLLAAPDPPRDDERLLPCRRRLDIRCAGLRP